MTSKGLQLYLLTEMLTLIVVAALVLFSSAPMAAEKPAPDEAATSSPVKAKPKIDRSGRTQTGKASIYSEKFNNKTMADGNKMDPHDDNAASKTLPLGTKAKVTNLETGQSTEVTIQDRGPHVKGRIVDLPPSKAQEIGLTKKQGVAKVEVAPVEIPLPNGGVKLGDGAATKQD
jgi:rare lipoprotein A